MTVIEPDHAASSPAAPFTAERRPSRAKTIIGWTIVAVLVLIVAMVGLRVAVTAPARAVLSTPKPETTAAPSRSRTSCAIRASRSTCAARGPRRSQRSTKTRHS